MLPQTRRYEINRNRNRNERFKVYDQMSPDEFALKMSQIALNTDEESSHLDADDLMCRVLIKMGYVDGVNVFKRMKKWYA